MEKQVWLVKDLTGHIEPMVGQVVRDNEAGVVDFFDEEGQSVGFFNLGALVSVLPAEEGEE